jgi:hypothetical protein
VPKALSGIFIICQVEKLCRFLLITPCFFISTSCTIPLQYESNRYSHAHRSKFLEPLGLELVTLGYSGKFWASGQARIDNCITMYQPVYLPVEPFLVLRQQNAHLGRIIKL